MIIINFLVEIAYGSWMGFFVVPGGGAGPLFGDATALPFEQMMVRRQYALETWVAIGGLSVYIAITESLPRRLRREDSPDRAGP